MKASPDSNSKGLGHVSENPFPAQIPKPAVAAHLGWEGGPCSPLPHCVWVTPLSSSVYKTVIRGACALIGHLWLPESLRVWRGIHTPHRGLRPQTQQMLVVCPSAPIFPVGCLEPVLSTHPTPLPSRQAEGGSCSSLQSNGGKRGGEGPTQPLLCIVSTNNGANEEPLSLT